MIALGPTSQAVKGQMPGLGCPSCELFRICGGVYDSWDCMGNCCGDPENCTTGCFKSKRFVEILRDSGGLHSNRIWNLRQAPRVLPGYIPRIDSGSERSRALSWPYVALTTFDVLKIDSDHKSPSFSTASKLREYFKVSPRSKIILLSIAKDDR